MTLQTSPQSKNDRSAPETNEQSEQVAELICQLISLLGHQNIALEARDDFLPGEIILDQTVDAVRYLLIRMPPATPSHAPLSPREREIVRLVANGHPTKVIADVLNISCWTVTAHLRRIFIKLGVTSRPAMVARLLEEGRSRHVQRGGEKALIDTKALADASANQGAEGTRPRTFVRA
jgi:two-component system, NarL family, nitrate/nitrite response regulator NarL